MFIYKTDKSRTWQEFKTIFASWGVEYLEKSKFGRMVSLQSPRPSIFEEYVILCKIAQIPSAKQSPE